MSSFLKGLKFNYTPIYEKLEFEACKLFTRGIKPIYFYHIRKTGGTSINGAFFKHFGFEFPLDYSKLSAKSNHLQLKKKKVIVGWNKQIIQLGSFHYAFSHIPFDQIQIPAKTFCFTCLRDPAERVLSHYKMIRYYQENSIYHESQKIENSWLGENFEEFLDRIPQHYLKNQLYMFSEKLNVAQAVERISKMDHVIFLNNFEIDMKVLGNKLSATFEILKEKSFKYHVEISENEITLLKSKLEDEYKMINLLK